MKKLTAKEIKKIQKLQNSINEAVELFEEISKHEIIEYQLGMNENILWSRLNGAKSIIDNLKLTLEINKEL